MFAEMAAPSKAICVNGSTTPPRAGQLPFPGMSKLCSADAPATSSLPWLMHVFSGRGLDADQFSCQPEIGEVECPKLPDMEQKISAFLLGRGDYAYMGYSCKPPRYRCRLGCILPNIPAISLLTGAGCANAVHSPWNNSGGTQFWAPSRWSPTMAVDFGKPLEAGCRETSPGVYERRYEHRTVMLDCGAWSASFEPVPAGGYGGFGTRLPAR